MKYEVHYYPDDKATIQDESDGRTLKEAPPRPATHAEADQYRKDEIKKYEDSK